jgi:hypothetical protein
VSLFYCLYLRREKRRKKERQQEEMGKSVLITGANRGYVSSFPSDMGKLTSQGRIRIDKSIPGEGMESDRSRPGSFQDAKS